MAEEQNSGILRSEREAAAGGELVRVRRDGKIAASPVASRAELAEHTARVAKATEKQDPPRRFEVRRRTDNELILFVADRRESWIVYPPRSQYEFLDRPAAGTVLVEHHPWEPYTAPVIHEVDAAQGCHEHGLGCGASSAIQAGVRAGWNPFS
ncbi:MAG: hypothetical protein AB7K36_22495 [Chloroflexota bacterium]